MSKIWNFYKKKLLDRFRLDCFILITTPVKTSFKDCCKGNMVIKVTIVVLVTIVTFGYFGYGYYGCIIRLL
jgi:hypothetical protein